MIGQPRVNQTLHQALAHNDVRRRQVLQGKPRAKVVCISWQWGWGAVVLGQALERNTTVGA